MTLPLVLINGWAMPEIVLNPLVSQLTDIDITIVNLSDINLIADNLRLSCMVQSLAERLPDRPFVLAGWSYGGMLACVYASAFPDNVKALVTLATNPCFVATPDWPMGMSPATFYEFLTGFSIAPEKTLGQFSVLCSIGSKNQRQLIRYLKGLLTVDNALPNMLATLGGADVRHDLSVINCPATHCYGEGDALVPGEVADYVQSYCDHHRVYRSSGGHCFLLETPDPVAALLKKYCQGGR